MKLNKLFSLDNKVAIVTGGSRGIGLGMAKALAEAGASIVIVNRKKAEGEIAAERLKRDGAKCLPIAADVSNRLDVVRMVEECVKYFKTIDILVNCAGITLRKSMNEIQEKEWDKVINVNLKGAFLTCQEVGKILVKEKRGKIINVSSVTAVRALEARIPYCTSKAGLSQFTKALALEWAPFHINVNAIAPGPIVTEYTKELLKEGTPFYEKNIGKVPMGRFGIPDDLAGTTVFLASSASDYITGQTIFVDGGWTVW